MNGNRNIRRSRRTIGVLVALVVVAASAGAVFATTQSPTASPPNAAALEARQALCLETQKAVLAERVAAGTLTQADADAQYAGIQERIEACDGTATGVGAMRRIGQNGTAGTTGSGTGYGRGAMNGNRGGNAGVCIVTPAA